MQWYLHLIRRRETSARKPRRLKWFSKTWHKRTKCSISPCFNHFNLQFSCHSPFGLDNLEVCLALVRAARSVYNYDGGNHCGQDRGRLNSYHHYQWADQWQAHVWPIPVCSHTQQQIYKQHRQENDNNHQDTLFINLFIFLLWSFLFLWFVSFKKIFKCVDVQFQSPHYSIPASLRLIAL